jgi:hypothetical protein
MCTRFVMPLLLSVSAGCATPSIKHAEIKDAINDLRTSTPETRAALQGVTYQAMGNSLLINEVLSADNKPTGTFTVSSLPVVADDKTYVV